MLIVVPLSSLFRYRIREVVARYIPSYPHRTIVNLDIQGGQSFKTEVFGYDVPESVVISEINFDFAKVFPRPINRPNIFDDIRVWIHANPRHAPYVGPSEIRPSSTALNYVRGVLEYGRGTYRTDTSIAEPLSRYLHSVMNMGGSNNPTVTNTPNQPPSARIVVMNLKLQDSSLRSYHLLSHQSGLLLDFSERVLRSNRSFIVRAPDQDSYTKIAKKNNRTDNFSPKFYCFASAFLFLLSLFLIGFGWWYAHNGDGSVGWGLLK